MKKTFPHSYQPTESQEERRSLFPFAVPPPRRLHVATSFSLGISLALLILSIPTITAQSTTYHYPAQDFASETLQDGRHNEPNPTGIWSDKTTLWMADVGDDKLYAYDLATQQRVSSQDFTLAAENDHPYGLWSNGTTMWVADWEDDKLYAYKMSDKSRDSSKDFDTLRNAQNEHPQGLWSDGTTMWVSDRDDDKIYAYKMSDQSRDSGKDFTLVGDLQEDGGRYNPFPQGLWSDGTTMWVADFNGGEDNEGNKIYAYKMSDKSRDADKDFNALNDAGNDKARGIWSNGATMWVADREDNKIYAYRSFAFRNAAQDFNTLNAAGNTAPRGLWSDDQTLWVADAGDDKLYAYDLATKQRDYGKEFALHADNSNPTGIWSDKTTMWVANSDLLTVKSNDQIYAYNLTTKSLVSTNAFTLDDKNFRLTGLWSDGTTLWVADTADKIYAYKMADKSRDRAKDIDLQNLIGNRNIQGIWSDGATLWAADRAVTGRTSKVYAFNLSGPTRDSAKDFDTLSAAGNHQPRGLWSDGTTLWATDSLNSKIYAYRLSDAATLYTLNLASKIPLSTTESTNVSVSLNPDFDSGTARYTASVPYASTNFTVSPTVLYTNSTTVSISPADADAITGHQVNLSIGTNQVSITVTNALTNSLPRTRTYTVNVRREFYTFNDPLQDVALTSLASTNIQGFWSDGTTMWVSAWEEMDNSNVGKIYAYKMSDKSRDTDKNFNTSNNADENNEPRGIWSDGMTMWVVDSADCKIYAYNMWTTNQQQRTVWDGSRVPNKDFNTLEGAGNKNPMWIWSDGVTMWVTDEADNKIYAYKMTDKNKDESKNIDYDSNLLSNSGNMQSTGIWSDGATMWVADSENAKLYAYKLTGNRVDCREEGKDFNTLKAVGNTDPTGIWSDGTTMWILDSGDKKLYAYNQPLSGNASLKSLSLSDVYVGTNDFSNFFSRDTSHYTNSEVHYNDAYVIYTTASTTVEAMTRRDSNATMDIQPPDVDLNTPGHQVNLTQSSNTITITVVAENKDSKRYTVNIARESGRRTPIKDFKEADLSMRNSTPTGLWGNATSTNIAQNLWVADGGQDKIYAYDLASKTEITANGFNMLAAAGNTSPWGIWSDETTMWVTDYSSNKVYSYNMGGNKGQDTKEIQLISNSKSTGLWADGETMWVASETFKEIYAYDMWKTNAQGTTVWKGSRNSTNDIAYPRLDNANNKNPLGIWSDGTTMWVANGDPSTNTNIKIYAYNMWTNNMQETPVWDGSRDPNKDLNDLHSRLNLDSRTEFKGGIWSDGATLWVSVVHADARGKNLYAFNLPQTPPSNDVVENSESEDSTLRALRLSGVTLTPDFSPDQTEYTAMVDHDVASTTVTAAPNDLEAGVEIFWASHETASRRTANRGAQVSLEEGYNLIAVYVTAENGIGETYFVEVTKAEPPPVSGGPLPAFQSASVSGNPTESTASSSAENETRQGRLLFAETLPNGGVRFVFLVPAEEFQMEETVELLSRNWRPLPDDAFQTTRESLGAGQDKLTVILPQAEGGQRFLRLMPQR